MMVDRIKLARKAYGVGSIGFIFIGGLHTVVHLMDLAGPDLQRRFHELGAIDVSGQSTASWDLFQGISLLMGLFSVAVGLIDFSALRVTKTSELPPIGVAVANMLMLLAIIMVGAAYLGPIQIYGGMFGITVFGVGPAIAMSDRWFAHRLVAN